jgi:hypothetical protein
MAPCSVTEVMTVSVLDRAQTRVLNRRLPLRFLQHPRLWETW